MGFMGDLLKVGFMGFVGGELKKWLSWVLWVC